MTKYPKYLSCFIFLLVMSIQLDGQFYSFKQHIDRAEESYEKKNYLEALYHFEKAKEIKGSLSEAYLYEAAESAFQTYSLPLAEQYYQAYIDQEDETHMPEALQKLAQIKASLGRYEEAILDYNIYLSEFDDIDSNVTKRIQFLKSSAQWAIDAEVESMVDSVQKYHNVNTEYSEFAPFYVGDSILYSRLAYPFKKKKEQIFLSKIKFGQQELQIDGLDEESLLSHPALSPDGKYLFFTVSTYENYNAVISEIYYAAVDTTVKPVTRAIKLGENINLPGFSSAHPTVVAHDEGMRLFFASNRPGGAGGMDLYFANLDVDLEASKAFNLEALNTPYDEFSPFVHPLSQMIYYSSNGLPGYGGFDVYKSTYPDYDTPENLGDIINSTHNDVFFRLNEDGSKCVIASNRPSSFYIENQFKTCCYDIYEGQVTTCAIDLQLLALNAETGQPLNGASIKVVNKDTDAIVFEGEIDGNQKELELECGYTYTIEGSKAGFLPVTLEIGEDNIVYGKRNELVRKLMFEPAVYQLLVAVHDLDTDRPLDSLDLVLKNLSTEEMTTIEKHPSSEITFSVDPGIEYEIKVSRNGYIDKVETFNTGLGASLIERKILLEEKEIIKKAKISMANAIPVELYFDHDSPDKGTMKETSTQNYTQTYYKYYNNKSKYVNNYSSQFGGSKKDDALNDIENFFENEVKRGFKKYETFKNQLILVLQSGQKVNIYLRGYASPIAQSDYNTALGRRRVDSVRKEFDEWGGGALLPYIRSGQLVVTERSFGEDTSPNTVSDDPRKPGQSIYSPFAAMERRVEIDEINFNDN